MWIIKTPGFSVQVQKIMLIAVYYFATKSIMIAVSDHTNTNPTDATVIAVDAMIAAALVKFPAREKEEKEKAVLI